MFKVYLYRATVSVTFPTSHDAWPIAFYLVPTDQALELTLISSYYPDLEHIFMVPKVFEPLKFYCNTKTMLIKILIGLESGYSSLNSTGHFFCR